MIRTIFTIVLTLFWCSSAIASGMRLHLWVAELAAKQLSYDELSTILYENEGAYKAGAVFPDTGYVINHAYGEKAHWSKFLNSYLSYLIRVCPYQEIEQRNCRQLVSHFFGSLSHTILDIRFDRLIVNKSAQVDFNGSIAHAQASLDSDLDFIAIFERGRSLDLPFFNAPIDSLLTILTGLVDEPLTRNQLLLGNHLLTIGYSLEPLAAAIRYPIVKRKLKNSWAYANFEHNRGGVRDSARLISSAYELIWNAYITTSQDLAFSESGTWPNVDFSIFGNELSTL